MVTIDHLNVTVTVEGHADADEAAFARLFDKYIEIWQRELLMRAAQEARSAEDRSLGDRSAHGVGQG